MRIAEALAISNRLETMYGEFGYEVVKIPPGGIEQRAELVASWRDGA